MLSAALQHAPDPDTHTAHRVSLTLTPTQHTVLACTKWRELNNVGNSDMLICLDHQRLQ